MGGPNGKATLSPPPEEVAPGSLVQQLMEDPMSAVGGQSSHHAPTLRQGLDADTTLVWKPPKWENALKLG